MAIVSDVEIRLRADIARLQQDLNNARRSVSGAVGDIKKTLASMAAGFSLVAMAKQVIDAQRQFDKLNSSLITVTGSNKAAGQAFAVLQDFAAKTPFGLQEVTSAFLKLRNLGLTPSERALTAYGNTASGMGKDLNQLIEAVADAATGEFERLKEFGIKSKKQGDDVAFTFQGTTTRVGNNSKEIEAYLMKIGEVNFAGGMERQAATLDGALSALGDQWDQTLVAFSQSGFGDVVYSTVLSLSGALQDLAAMFKSVTGVADEEGKKVEEVGLLHKGLTTFFETIMVLGVNVAYVFKTIGKDIGAFAAQAAALFNGGMGGLTDGSTLRAVQDIGRARVEEAKRERDEVDATSEKILGAAKAAQDARAKEAAERAKDTRDRLEQYKIQGEATKGLSDTEKKAAEKRLQAFKDMETAAKIRVAETAREAAGLAPLNAAEKEAIELTEKLAAKKIVLTTAQEKRLRGLIEEERANLAAIQSHKAYAKMQEESGKLDGEMADMRADKLKAARDEVKANKELVATFGMSEAAIARLEVARLREQLAQRGSVGMTLDEIENLEKLIELKEQSAAAIADREELQKVQSFWTDIEKTAHDTFMSIEDGGKGMWQRMKETAKNTFFNWLYQMTVKKWIINIGTSISGTAGVSGIAQAADALGGSTSAGGGNVGSLLSMGQSIYNGFASGFSSVGAGLGTYVSALGNAMGSSAVSAFGSGMGLSSAQAAQAAAAYNGAGMASTGSAISAGSAAGSVASVAAGAAIGHYGGRAISNGYSAAGSSGNALVNVGTGAGGVIGYMMGGPLGAALGAAIGGLIGGGINRAFGHKAREYEDPQVTGTLSATGASGTTSSKWLEEGGWFRSDRRGVESAAIGKEMSDLLSGGFNAIKDVTVGFAEVFGQSAEVVAGYSKALNFTVTQDAAKNEAMLTELFSTIGDEMAARVVPNIAIFQRSGETAAQTLERLAGSFKVVDGVLTTLGLTSQQAFRAVGVASIEARERLVALAGGVDALAAQTQFFADNFLTNAQKIAPMERQVNEQLAALGYGGIFTATQFRVAVEDLARSGALATEEGAKTYAGLMALAPAFKTLNDYMLEMKRADADEAMQALQRAVDAQRNSVAAAYESVMSALRTRLDTVGDSIARMTDLSRDLKGALVGVEAPGSVTASRQVAEAEIAAALALAKASSVLPSADALTDALDALGRNSADGFATLAEYQRATARSNAQLSELGGLTDAQLGTAELQLRALEAQQAQAEAANAAELSRLDAIMSNAQLQLDAANNINTGIMGVEAAAVAALAAIRSLNIANGGYGGVAVQPVAPAVPMVADYTQSGTMPEESGLLAELRRMNERLGNIEVSNSQMAVDNAQLARQFNDVTAGGNVLLTESA